MAVINGFLSQTIVYGGIVNPNLSADMMGFALDWWPAHTSVSGVSPLGAMVASWPIEANGVAINGFVAGAYSDDFYHRVHIIPALLDLGNIISTQTSPVKIWNAFFTAIELAAINGLDDGIELSGQSAPPIAFAALQERTWNVAITPDGPAVLNAELDWVFTNGSVATLAITGNRISAFPFSVDWSDGIAERLVWATDILQSPTGAEQRRALRLAPRRSVETQIILEGRERQAFDLAMFGWGARVWAVPFWPDIQQLYNSVSAGDFLITCATVNYDFRANGLAILLGENSFQYETVEILSISPTQLTLKRALIKSWPAGTRLYPVRTAQLDQAPELQRLTDTLQRCTVAFGVVEPCEWPAVLPATTYRSYPVFETAPDESQDLTSQFQHMRLQLDNGSAMPRVTETAKTPFHLQQYRWCLHGRAERAAFRSLAYALRGRQISVWVPTHADDLTLVAVVTNSTTYIDVAAIGYTRYGQARVGRRDIRVQLRNGTVFYRRIIASTEISDDVERLQVDAVFDVQINVADVMRISWLMLMRQDSDTIEIQHETDSAGLATTQQMFRGVRDDDI